MNGAGTTRERPDPTVAFIPSSGDPDGMDVERTVCPQCGFAVARREDVCRLCDEADGGATDPSGG